MRGQARFHLPALVVLIALVALALLFLAAGCREDGAGTTQEPATPPTAAFASGLTCLSKEAARDPADGTPECVRWQYDRQTGRLSLVHASAVLNCCPEGPPDATWEEDGLVLVENGTGGLCGCLCVYDLAYTCTGVAPQAVTVTIRTAYPLHDEPVLTGTLDLAAEDSGEFCVIRTGYPWEPWGGR